MGTAEAQTNCLNYVCRELRIPFVTNPRTRVPIAQLLPYLSVIQESSNPEIIYSPLPLHQMVILTEAYGARETILHAAMKTDKLPIWLNGQPIKGADHIPWYLQVRNCYGARPEFVALHNVIDPYYPGQSLHPLKRIIFANVVENATCI